MSIISKKLQKQLIKTLGSTHSDTCIISVHFILEGFKACTSRKSYLNANLFDAYPSESSPEGRCDCIKEMWVVMKMQASQIVQNKNNS